MGSVQLLARQWRITDRMGREQQVSGKGVVGQTPNIAAGESFTYTSGAPLTEPSGMMQGAYLLTDTHGEQFTVDIPAFSLDSPYDSGALN